MYRYVLQRSLRFRRHQRLNRHRSRFRLKVLLGTRRYGIARRLLSLLRQHAVNIRGQAGIEHHPFGDGLYLEAQQASRPRRGYSAA